MVAQARFDVRAHRIRLAAQTDVLHGYGRRSPRSRPRRSGITADANLRRAADARFLDELPSSESGHAGWGAVSAPRDWRGAARAGAAGASGERDATPAAPGARPGGGDRRTDDGRDVRLEPGSLRRGLPH